ncbi:MAG: response regulator [Actinobacteria bacterium]|nr:response regulator [Actinomycetota bacterium]
MAALGPEAEGPAHVLVVEDDDALRRSLVKLLDRNGYSCVPAATATDAHARLDDTDFDLVLTNMDMPGGSGLDLLMHVAAEHKDVATVVVTRSDDAAVARAALDAGAYGYVLKPFNENQMLINVASALRRRRAEMDKRAQMVRLEQMVRDRTGEMWSYVADLEKAQRDMRLLQEETIQRLSIAAEFRDDETPRHIQRMSRYCALIADRAGMDADRCELIRVSSALHDVGKIGVPDQILFKPGPLDVEERAVMERHCEVGHRILSGSNTPVLNLAATIALTHHERVDGSGYPRGLVGEGIPIEGRIAAIADVFDALTTNKVYRAAIPMTKAIEIMMEERGRHFDATLLDVFLSEKGRILGIKERYADLDQDEAELNPLSALVAEL